MNPLGPHLKWLIKSNGHTQSQAARAAGVELRQLQRWCAGESLPRIDHVYAIADRGRRHAGTINRT